VGSDPSAVVSRQAKLQIPNTKLQINPKL